MERSFHPIHQSEDLDVVDVEVTFIVGTGGINPEAINPDSLRYNEVVNPEWQIQLPVVIEPGHSRVRYQGGLSISSTPSQLVFSQIGDALGSWNDVCLGALKRYLLVAPPQLDYRFVAIAPRSVVLRPFGHTGEPESLLSAAGKGVQFAGIAPDVQVRLSYQINGKSISLYVSEATKRDDPSTVETRFRGHLRHNVTGNQLSEKRRAVDEILNNAGDDIGAFHELARQFVLNSLAEEQ